MCFCVHFSEINCVCAPGEHVNKKKKEYLIDYYYDYCSQVIDLLLASDFCVINASYILKFTIDLVLFTVRFKYEI